MSCVGFCIKQHAAAKAKVALQIDVGQLFGLGKSGKVNKTTSWSLTVDVKNMGKRARANSHYRTQHKPDCLVKV